LSYKLVKGVENVSLNLECEGANKESKIRFSTPQRCHVQVNPMRISYAVFSILFVLAIIPLLFVHPVLSLLSMICSIFDIYSFAVLNAVHYQFEKEYYNTLNQPQSTFPLPFETLHDPIIYTTQNWSHTDKAPLVV
jgi:hypothetical protein